MPSQLPRFTLRLAPGLLRKLVYIADQNGRSTNKEIELIIKEHIQKFEKRYGKILDE